MMKTQNRFIRIVLLFLVLSFSTLSCSKDDNLAAEEIEKEIGAITLDTREFELKKGNRRQLTVTNDIGEAQVVWSVDHSNIAAVDQEGRVTALANGRTTITAKVGSETATSIVLVSPDIYVAGRETNGTAMVAKYWKNGSAVELSDGTRNAWTGAIKVVNDNIFVAGGEEINDQLVPKSWENGQGSFLSNNMKVGWAEDVFIENNVAYYAGIQERAETTQTHGVATYWTSNQSSPIPFTGNANTSRLHSIFVKDNDIYTAGREYNGNAWVAKYWINNEPIVLSDGIEDAMAYSVIVSGENVYVAGFETVDDKKVAKLWINREGQNLSDGTTDEAAKTMFIDGDDVYLAGYGSIGGKLVARYWKNGEPVTFTDGTQDALINSIFVYGGDVYATGYESNGEYGVAKYWKNGEEVALSARPSETQSIFIY